MNRTEAITELIRIWHSPHLDLSLKGNLGEVIEGLKENHPWCVECKEYDQEQRCCHRWSSQIRMTIEDWERENKVVRCKDCKNYRQVVEHDWERCRHFLAYVEPWDYCSYGERGDTDD